MGGQKRLWGKPNCLAHALLEDATGSTVLVDTTELRLNSAIGSVLVMNTELRLEDMAAWYLYQCAGLHSATKSPSGRIDTLNDSFAMCRSLKKSINPDNMLTISLAVAGDNSADSDLQRCLR